MGSLVPFSRRSIARREARPSYQDPRVPLIKTQHAALTYGNIRKVVHHPDSGVPEEDAELISMMARDYTLRTIAGILGV